MKYKTTTEAELRRLVASGLTHAEIAVKIGCDRSCVSKACALLGIFNEKRSSMRNHKKRDLSAWVKRLIDGENQAAIARDEGIHKSRVSQLLIEAGLPTTTEEARRKAAKQAAEAALTAGQWVGGLRTPERA